MRQFVLGVILFFFCTSLFAQKGTLSGRIVSQSTQEPLAECHVFIPNTTFQAYTDKDGNFQLSGIPYGRWGVVAIKEGFEASSQVSGIGRAQTKLDDWRLADGVALKEKPLKDSQLKKAKSDLEKRMGLDSKDSELVLINPEVLNFYSLEGSEDSWVDFSDVLLVQNLKIGYLISLRLKAPQNLSKGLRPSDFLLSYLEMDFSSVEEKNLINSNRVSAYENSMVYAIRQLIGRNSSEFVARPSEREGEIFLRANSPVEIKMPNKELRFLAFTEDGIELRANGTPVFPELIRGQGFPISDFPLRTLPLDFDYDAALAATQMDRSLLAQQERVFLQTDKDVYMMGDKLLFKAYLQLGNPLLINEASKVLHVEIIDPTGYSMLHKVFPLENGMSSGEIQLGPELDTKDFVLKAYTLWGSNYGADFEYYKPIQVMSSLWKVESNQLEPKAEGLVLFSDKEVYSSQDSVTLNVIVKNKKGAVAAGNLSLTVVQDKGIQSEDSSNDLLIDFFQMKPQLNQVDSSRFVFDKEYLLTLKGEIKDSVSMINSSLIEVLVNGFLDRRELKVNSSGEFIVDGIDAKEDFSVLVKATARNGMPLNDVELKLLGSENRQVFSESKFEGVQSLSARPPSVDSLISDYLKMREGEILLDEVEVEDVREDYLGTMPHGRPQGVLEMEVVYLSGQTDQFIYSFANRTGFQAGGIPPMIINKRGGAGGPPLILLNGVPITPVSGTTFGSGYTGSQYMALQSINVFTIKKIEYIRSIVSMYGEGGRWGVINIITKTGSEIAKDINTYKEFKLSGLEKVTTEAVTSVVSRKVCK